MELKIDEVFKDICKQIIAENKSKAEWAEIQSCDMYQTEHFVGGFDAEEQEFCFSYYDEKKEEYWFQIDLDVVQQIVNGKKLMIENLRKA